MSKHTPGPWHVVTSYEYSGKEPAGAKPERPRYSIGHGPDDPIQRSFVNTQYDLNNARLIAAAPEMYEALRAVDADFRQTIFPPASHASGREARRLVHKVRAALRAAGGSDG